VVVVVKEELRGTTFQVKDRPDFLAGWEVTPDDDDVRAFVFPSGEGLDLVAIQEVAQ